MGDTDDEDMTFYAAFDGHEPQRFYTLQSAMAWAEELKRPTGTISFMGRDVVRYDDGDVNLADE